jgi:hypothetical protein
LENLVGSRHAMPLIQPLNQPSQFLTAASTAESSREQPTVLQAMPEISSRRVQSAGTFAYCLRRLSATLQNQQYKFHL